LGVRTHFVFIDEKRHVKPNGSSPMLPSRA
jgi:hypothetical protein